MASLAELEGYFKGLAEATRLRIINLLLYGELCGCDIQYVLNLTQSNVSRHLTYLKHAGLVTDRREGFRVFHRLTDAANDRLRPLFEFLRSAFATDRIFQNDLLQLRQAIENGVCQMRPVAILPQLVRWEPQAGSAGTAQSGSPPLRSEGHVQVSFAEAETPAGSGKRASKR